MPDVLEYMENDVPEPPAGIGLKMMIPGPGGQIHHH